MADARTKKEPSIQELKTTITRLEQQLETVQAESEKYKREKIQAETRGASFGSDVERQRAITQAEQKYKDQISEIQQKLDAANAKLKDAAAKAEEKVRAVTEDADRKIKEAKDQAQKDAKEAALKAEEEKKALLAKIEQDKTTVQAAAKALEEKQHLADLLAAIEQKFEEVKKEKQENARQISTLTTELERLKKEETSMLNKVIAAIWEDDKKVDEKKAEEKITQEQALAKIRKSKLEHEAAIKKLQGENQALQKQYDELKTEKDALAEHQTSLAKDLTEATQQLDLLYRQAVSPHAVALAFSGGEMKSVLNEAQLTTIIDKLVEETKRELADAAHGDIKAMSMDQVLQMLEKNIGQYFNPSSVLLAGAASALVFMWYLESTLPSGAELSARSSLFKSWFEETPNAEKVVSDYNLSLSFLPLVGLMLPTTALPLSIAYVTTQSVLALYSIGKFWYDVWHEPWGNVPKKALQRMFCDEKGEPSFRQIINTMIPVMTWISAIRSSQTIGEILNQLILDPAHYDDLAGVCPIEHEAMSCIAAVFLKSPLLIAELTAAVSIASIHLGPTFVGKLGQLIYAIYNRIEQCRRRDLRQPLLHERKARSEREESKSGVYGATVSESASGYANVSSSMLASSVTDASALGKDHVAVGIDSESVPISSSNNTGSSVHDSASATFASAGLASLHSTTPDVVQVKVDEIQPPKDEEKKDEKKEEKAPVVENEAAAQTPSSSPT